MQVWGTCLGHQLLQILTANTSYNELLVQTDSVVSSIAIPFPCPDRANSMHGQRAVVL